MSEDIYQDVLKHIPSSEQNMRRLEYLQNDASEMRIAVFGKYNHGKSSLLNAILGEECFSVADKRETVEIKEVSRDNIVWIDTPGLDADIQGDDDKKAREGAFELADFIFLVHRADAGELDKYEQQIYAELMRQDHNYKNKLFMIVSVIDQVGSTENVDTVIEEITSQLPDLTIIPVSSSRYIKGVAENKAKLVELSGMQALFDLTDKLKAEKDSLRKLESDRLLKKAILELSDAIKNKQAEYAYLQHESMKHQRAFNTAVDKLVVKLSAA